MDVDVRITVLQDSGSSTAIRMVLNLPVILSNVRIEGSTYST